MKRQHTLKRSFQYENILLEMTDLLKQFPGYISVDFTDDDFRNKKYHGCDKLIVYSWRSHGEWAPPTKEVYGRYYKPKTA